MIRSNQTTPVRSPAKAMRRIVSIVALGLVLASCSSNLPQSSLNPKSVEAQKIDGLWILVFSIATVIFFAVQIALIVSIVRWRRRPGRH